MAGPINYLIDTSVVIRHPEVLSLARTRKILIPDVVIHELTAVRNARVQPGIQNLLSQALDAGAEVVQSSLNMKPDPLSAAQRMGKLSFADHQIAQSAVELIKEGKAVTVVTYDQALRYLLDSQNVPSMSPDTFLALKDDAKPDEAITAAAQNFTSQQNSYAGISVFGALIAGGIAYAAYTYRALLLATLSMWGTVLLLFAAGVLLYAYRQRQRLSYGVFEFLFGLFVAVSVFLPNFNYNSLGVLNTVQIVGGLYVMVRGLDNVGKGIEGTRFESGWRWMFKNI